MSQEYYCPDCEFLKFKLVLKTIHRNNQWILAYICLNCHRVFDLIESPKMEQCQHCNGSGEGFDWKTYKSVPDSCTRCHGRGWREIE